MADVPSRVHSRKGSHDTLKKVSGLRTIATVAVIFLASLGCVRLLLTQMPELTEEETATVKLPRNLDDAKALGAVLLRYNEDNYYRLMLLFVSCYIFLQSFAIPGSISLSIISGALFPFPLALFLVCTCSAVGASNAYMISKYFGVAFVQHYFPERCEQWRQQVDKHRQHLLNYMIFLRITPFLPNWFINIAAPVIKVDWTPFFLGTFIGVAPPSMLFVRAGSALQQLTTTNEIMPWSTMLTLIGFGFVTLIPIVFQNRLRGRLDGQKREKQEEDVKVK